MSALKAAPVATLIVVLAGVGWYVATKPDPRLVSLREKLVLASEPADPLTPTEVKESFIEPTEFALAGRVDAGEMEPFEDGKATFVLSQLPDKAHAGGDPNHADNCPFCKRKLRLAPKVMVQFLDAEGNIIAVDARDLFEIEKGAAVVVQGRGQYVEAINSVQMDAAGIFVRR